MSRIKRLWIPEKPKVAIEVVRALQAIHKVKPINDMRKDGFSLLSNGDCVSSVFGHMLQMLPPSKYFNKEQNINPMDHLPLVPKPFKMEPKPDTTKDGKPKTRNGEIVPLARFTLLKKLIKEAEVIVNACDIDREGQLIFDELLEYVGRDPYANNIHRTAIVTLTEDAVIKSLSNLDKNSDPKWRLRGSAAKTRQAMDWLLGMNASMAYQCVTGIRKVSVGRVQTPVLALVYKRDLEIENFKEQDYYVPVISLADGTVMRWDHRPDAAGSKGFDANGRIIDKVIAQAIIDGIQAGKPGEIIASKTQEKKKAPPLPFSLGALQSYASRTLGLSVEQVTKVAQDLYERYKVITYVGTDCQYLSKEMHAQASDVMGALSQLWPDIIEEAIPELVSKAFNDSKVDEHFAIIPTGVVPNFSDKETVHRDLFQIIAFRYIAQFYPDYRYMASSVSAKFGEDIFKATAKADVDLGWKKIENNKDDESEQNDESDS